MIMMARDRDYDALLSQMKGRHVAIWTCNTCARLCNGLGGRDAADRLAERLRSDGIDVVSVDSTSASCIMAKAESGFSQLDPDSYDIVLSLTCDIGSMCAARASGKETVNPVITFGAGYIDTDGRPRVCSVLCGNVMTDEALDDVAASSDSVAGPYV